MAKNIKQVYDANPSTTALGTDLVYLGKSPYGLSDDSAILVSNLLAAVSGMNFVDATLGYYEVQNNTCYFVKAPGKVFFRTPAVMAKGYNFMIIGEGGSPINNWSLSTQTSQSLIDGAIISNVGSDRYATLETSSPTDRAWFICTTANQDVTVGWSQGAGLTMFEQTAIDPVLVDGVTTTLFNVNIMGLAKSTYTGPLLQIQRDTDNEICLVQPDSLNRPGFFSLTDFGGGQTVAQFVCGANIAVLTILDQLGNGTLGNGVDLSGGGTWIDSSGNMKTVTPQGNPAFTTFGAGSYIGTYPINYTGTELNVFSVASLSANINSESALVNFYNPANGDDYASALNCIAFRQPIPGNTNFITTRLADLSTKSLLPANQRMVLTTTFDGANNVMSINNTNGTLVASTGAFGINKILLSGRYISGAVDHEGYYNYAGVVACGTINPGDFDYIRDWMNTYL